MSLTRLFRTLRIKRALAKGYARQRAVREARAEAAHRGITTEWKRRGTACRQLMGENHGGTCMQPGGGHNGGEHPPH